MPTIVFQVNLSTVNQLSHKQPYNSTEAEYFDSTRSTWFPDILRNNRKLKHGDTITIEGQNAIYLLDNYTSGTYKFLDVVSTT